MITDAHLHIQTGRPGEGKEYFPKRHSWVSAMHRAYGGRPPYRDPNDVFHSLQLYPWEKHSRGRRRTGTPSGLR